MEKPNAKSLAEVEDDCSWAGNSRMTSSNRALLLKQPQILEQPGSIASICI